MDCSATRNRMMPPAIRSAPVEILQVPSTLTPMVVATKTVLATAMEGVAVVIKTVLAMAMVAAVVVEVAIKTVLAMTMVVVVVAIRTVLAMAKEGEDTKIVHAIMMATNLSLLILPGEIIQTSRQRKNANALSGNKILIRPLLQKKIKNY